MNTVTYAPVYDAGCVAELLHVIYNADVLAAFGPQPVSLPGFVTFFDPGWSVLGLRTALEFLGKQLLTDARWYIKEPFAKVADDPRYRQLRMEAISESFGKSFAEQQALIPEGEEIPTARVVVMGMVIHFLATGERLFPDYYVRCIDQASGGDRVRVGRFDSGGFDVDDDWAGDRLDGLGLASSVPPRKF